MHIGAYIVNYPVNSLYACRHRHKGAEWRYSHAPHGYACVLTRKYRWSGERGTRHGIRPAHTGCALRRRGRRI